MTNSYHTSESQPRLALVTGATGYVGSQVIDELVAQGWKVRAFCRSEDKAKTMSWADHLPHDGQSAGPSEVELFLGDASSADDVRDALEGVDAAWYLLHSMSNSDDFINAEVSMAKTFGDAAASQNVGRIVYLGGLHPSDEKVSELSDHLKSRAKVGQALIDSGVPTAALQAGVVLGSGSSSFVMLGNLAERLPAIVGPQWINNKITPISIRDVVFYLVKAADLPKDLSQTFDIGNPESLPYVEMIQRYAEVADLGPRPVFTAPVATPALAARAIAFLTPVDAQLVSPLIDSLLHETVVEERDLQDLVGTPEGGLQSFEEAIRDAIGDRDTRRWRKILSATTAATAATAAIGSLGTKPKSRSYQRLRKPSWMPPAAAFPIAWTLLYADIAVSGALLIADSKKLREDAAALGANLALNAAWPATFFVAKNRLLSTIGAGLLAASSADLMRRVSAQGTERAAVLAPYPAWTGFATALSGAIAWLNRSRR